MSAPRFLACCRLCSDPNVYVASFAACSVFTSAGVVRFKHHLHSTLEVAGDNFKQKQKQEKEQEREQEQNESKHQNQKEGRRIILSGFEVEARPCKD